MLTDTPPVYIEPKQAEVRPFVKPEGNFLEPIHCQTLETALSLKSVHGGFITKSWRGGYDLVYPKNETY